MLCTCGLLHCKASHFYRHLCRQSNRVRIVEPSAAGLIIIHFIVIYRSIKKSLENLLSSDQLIIER